LELVEQVVGQTLVLLHQVVVILFLEQLHLLEVVEQVEEHQI
jgi:hypothetical protein